jgi:hypothetical protein
MASLQLELHADDPAVEGLITRNRIKPSSPREAGSLRGRYQHCQSVDPAHYLHYPDRWDVDHAAHSCQALH